MAKTLTGGCFCGAIRYEVTADPLMTGHCQCKNCQKDSGTGHASLMMFPKAAMKITGKAKEYQRKADSGNTVSHGFCAICGSPLFGSTSGMPQGMAIMAGSLDDPSAFSAQFLVYTASAQPWDHIDLQGPKFPGMPPMA